MWQRRDEAEPSERKVLCYETDTFRSPSLVCIWNTTWWNSAAPPDVSLHIFTRTKGHVFLLFEREITYTTAIPVPFLTFHLSRVWPLLCSSAQIFQKAAECQRERAEVNSSSHSPCLGFINGFIISRSIPAVHKRTAQYWLCRQIAVNPHRERPRPQSISSQTG